MTPAPLEAQGKGTTSRELVDKLLTPYFDMLDAMSPRDGMKMNRQVHVDKALPSIEAAIQEAVAGAYQGGNRSVRLKQSGANRRMRVPNDWEAAFWVTFILLFVAVVALVIVAHDLGLAEGRIEREERQDG